MHTLVRLIFTSEVATALDANTMRHIALISERNNWRDGITGVLLAAGQRYVQVLEGERADVTACFVRIASDARNRSCKLLSLTYVPRRRFARWSMHAVQVTPAYEDAMDSMLDAVEAPSAGADPIGEQLTRLLKCAGAPIGAPEADAAAA